MKLNRLRLFKFINQFTNHHRPGNKKNIFIFSTPRSGSTWLNELICTQKGVKYCNEPLDLRIEKNSKISNIDSWEELYNQKVIDKLIKYFKNISSGKNRWLNPSPLNKNYNFSTNRISFKVINGAEPFINDIVDSCNGKLVYLIRHPLPVALSRKKTPRLDILTSDQVMKNFSQSIRNKSKNIKEKGDFLEKAVLSWCIQNKLALDIKQPDWLIITYEQLVTNPIPIIHLLEKELQLEDINKIIKQLNIASKVTVQSSKGTERMINNKLIEKEDLINRWKDKIDEEKEDKLFEIISCFGLDDIYIKRNSYPRDKYLIT